MFEYIRRIPLRYWPESTSDYRWERLPPPAEYASMHLSDISAVSSFFADRVSHVFSFMIRTLMLAIPMALAGPLVPRHYAIPIAVSLAWVSPVLALLRGHPLNLETFLQKLLTLPAIVLAFSFAGPFFGHRFAASLVLGLASALALKIASRDIHEFWQARVRADNRLSVKERAAIQLPPLQPDWTFVLLISIAILFIPLWSPFVACLFVLGITASFLAYRVAQARRAMPELRWNHLVSHAVEVVLYPRNYLLNFVPYPGCWNPRKYNRTLKSSFYALLLVTTHLSVSLSAFFPWDAPLFRHQFLSTFRTEIHGGPQAFSFARQSAPATDWNRFPAPYKASSDTVDAEWLNKELSGLSRDEQRTLLARFKNDMTQRAAHERRIDQSTAKALNGSPFLWVYVAIVGLFNNKPTFAYAIASIFLGAATIPPLFLLTVFFRGIVALRQTRMRIERDVRGDETKQVTEWERYTSILTHSDHTTDDPVTFKPVREADHLFMGHEPNLQFPVLLDKSILGQHAYILGGTGFGKTSLGIMPLVMRLIMGQAEPRKTKTETPPPGQSSFTFDGEHATTQSPMPPMLIIDLKGDMALFQTVKAEVERKAKAEGRTLQDAFRVFSCEKDHASHAFNPFANLGTNSRTNVELCNIFLDALNLNHGEGYGRSYYSLKSRSLLHFVLKNDKPNSFEELYAALKRRKRATEFREAFELVATIEALTDYDNICRDTGGSKDPVIHMPSVIRQRQVVYFWLPAAEHSLTAKEIASLALYTFYTALREWVKSNKWQKFQDTPPQGYLIIDEFQRVASRNFPNILREARAFGLGIIMAHQSASDLKLPDLDLAAIVSENTRLKLFFAIQDAREREVFAKLSGDELAVQTSFSTTAITSYKQYVPPGFTGQVRPMRWETKMIESMAETAIMKPRIMTNDIISTSDYPFDYFMLVGQGAGYTQFGGYPIPVRTFWPMSATLYSARSGASWPSGKELGLSEQVVEIKNAPKASKQKKEPTPRRIEVDKQIEDKLRALEIDDPSVFS